MVCCARDERLTAGECSPSRTPAGRSPSPACGAGWRGLPLRTINGADSGFRRTACLHPRLRVCAGLRFAVILLSKAMDVGRDHLIHRKRSPFPYEGKALMRLELGRDCECPARHFPFPAAFYFGVFAPRRGAGLQVTSSTAERSPFPSRGRTIARSKVSETANVEQRGNASLAGILKSRLNHVIRSLVSGLLLPVTGHFFLPTKII